MLSLENIRSSSSQQIPHISCNQRVHYCVQNTPPILPIISQTNRLQSPPTILTFFLILYYHLSLFCKWSLTSGSPPLNPAHISLWSHVSITLRLRTKMYLNLAQLALRRCSLQPYGNDGSCNEPSLVCNAR
jgi:hypothetical protein